MFLILQLHTPRACCEECSAFFFVTVDIFVDWVEDNPNLCVYTDMQLAKFPRVHLDCSRGSVPEVEKPFYKILICSAHEVNDLVEESEKMIIQLLPPMRKRLRR